MSETKILREKLGALIADINYEQKMTKLKILRNKFETMVENVKRGSSKIEKIKHGAARFQAGVLYEKTKNMAKNINPKEILEVGCYLYGTAKAINALT
jgi:hypothetical protein